MSTARANSVFLSSYRNTVLNQSARVFTLGYFPNIILECKDSYMKSQQVIIGSEAGNILIIHGSFFDQA